MQAKAARNVVNAVSKVLDAFEKRDKTGTVQFILKWFGLGLRYLLTLFPLIHMNIFYLVWVISKRFGNYSEKHPSKAHTILRSVSYTFIPISAMSTYFICYYAFGIFDVFTDQVVLYVMWFTWAFCIPIFWFIDLAYDKFDFDKSALRFIGVPNAKFTIDFVCESKEYTFLWVTSLIAMSPATIFGYFAGYIYDEFINIGNSRSLSCLKIDFDDSDAESYVETWNLCLDYYSDTDSNDYSYDNSTSMMSTTGAAYSSDSDSNTRVCCKLNSITTETFLDAFLYLTVVVFFSGMFVRFISDFVLRSEQVRNPKNFVSALKDQISKVKENVDNSVFSNKDKDNKDDKDGKDSRKGLNNDMDDDEDDSDLEDEFNINKTKSNVDLLLHDIKKIERKGQRKANNNNNNNNDDNNNDSNGDADDAGAAATTTTATTVEMQGRTDNAN